MNTRPSKNLALGFAVTIVVSAAVYGTAFAFFGWKGVVSTAVFCLLGLAFLARK